VIRFREGWYERGLAHAEAALGLAHELGDDQLRGRALVVRATIGWFAGDSDALTLALRAHEFALADGGEQLVQ
jgi:hypothetical protein